MGVIDICLDARVAHAIVVVDARAVIRLEGVEETPVEIEDVAQVSADARELEFWRRVSECRAVEAVEKSNSLFENGDVLLERGDDVAREFMRDRSLHGVGT